MRYEVYSSQALIPGDNGKIRKVNLICIARCASHAEAKRIADTHIRATGSWAIIKEVQ